MAKFIIEQKFWDVFPQAEIAIIVADGINNSPENAEASGAAAEIAKILAEANVTAKKWLTADVLSENDVIAVWRQAYQQFKTKKGVRCSIEALLKRIDKGNTIGNINPLVDIYNAVSLVYGLPCGGEDIHTFAGDMRLTKAEGGEAFIALGDEEPDNALPEEIIYKDDEGAVCRCWNWRDGQRTMLTENTRKAFLIIESVDPKRHEDVIAATKMLAEMTEKYLGGKVKISHMNIDNREMEL